MTWRHVIDRHDSPNCVRSMRLPNSALAPLIEYKLPKTDRKQNYGTWKCIASVVDATSALYRRTMICQVRSLQKTKKRTQQQKKNSRDPSSYADIYYSKFRILGVMLAEPLMFRGLFVDLKYNKCWTIYYILPHKFLSRLIDVTISCWGKNSRDLSSRTRITAKKWFAIGYQNNSPNQIDN